MGLVQSRASSRAYPMVQQDKDRGIYSVDVKCFTDPDILELERKLIYDKCWLYAAHDSELPSPGDYITRSIAGRNLLFSRGKDGKVRAFLNICRHKSAKLCRQSKGNATRFTCIYHAWTFANDGKLLATSMPEAYSPDFGEQDFDLFPVRLESYRGLLFVCYDNETIPLNEYVGQGAFDAMDLMLDQHESWEVLPSPYRYKMKANWKIIMENSMDALHVTTVHGSYVFDFMPKVAGITVSNSSLWVDGPEFATQRALGSGHMCFETSYFQVNLDGAKRDAWRQKFGADRADRMIDYTRNIDLFPNTFITEQFPLIRTHFPISVDETEVVTYALMPGNEDPKIRAGRMAALSSFQGPGGMGTPDDVELLEQCQESCHAMPDGATIDLSRGMMRKAKPEDELGARVFFDEWHRRLFG